MRARRDIVGVRDPSPSHPSIHPLVNSLPPRCRFEPTLPVGVVLCHMHMSCHPATLYGSSFRCPDKRPRINAPQTKTQRPPDKCPPDRCPQVPSRTDVSRTSALRTKAESTCPGGALSYLPFFLFTLYFPLILTNNDNLESLSCRYAQTVSISCPSQSHT